MSYWLEQLTLLAESLQKANELQGVLERLSHIITAAGFARCRVWSYEEKSNSFVGVAQSGLAHDQAKLFSGLTIKADEDSPLTRATTEPVVVKVEDQPNILSSLFTQPTRYWIDVPLHHEGKLIGIIAVDNKSSTARFSTDDLRFLKLAAFIITQRWLTVTRSGQTPAELISQFKKSYVLVLGKDVGEELSLLRAIQRYVDDLGFTSQLVKDALDIPEMSNEDKVRALADISRFVLLENSFPAGQIVEMKILSTNRIPTAILRQKSLGSTWMVADYDLDFRFMKEFTYKKESIAHVVKRACKWANHAVEVRTNQLNRRYPWRRPVKPQRERKKR